MVSLFKINSQESVAVEPTIGKVYCAMKYNDDLGRHQEGVIAEYAGEGQFFSDDCHFCTGLQDSINAEMSQADFIMEC